MQTMMYCEGRGSKRSASMTARHVKTCKLSKTCAKFRVKKAYDSITEYGAFDVSLHLTVAEQKQCEGYVKKTAKNKQKDKDELYILEACKITEEITGKTLQDMQSVSKLKEYTVARTIYFNICDLFGISQKKTSKALNKTLSTATQSQAKHSRLCVYDKDFRDKSKRSLEKAEAIIGKL